jgi:hypothetical protein
VRKHAWDTAEELTKGIGGSSWIEDVTAHLASGGILIASEEFVMLFRSVDTSWPEDRLDDPWQVDHSGDAWYIWMIVGNLRHVVGLVRSGTWPEKLAVAFHRRGNPKWYQLADLISKIDEKTQQRQSRQAAEAGEPAVAEELQHSDEDDEEADEAS